MSSGMSMIVDLMVVTLLVVTIAFAAVLNRRLTVWRQSRIEFERLIASSTTPPRAPKPASSA